MAPRPRPEIIGTDAAAGEQRGEQQRGLVADAAGGVLVDFSARKVRQIDDRTRPSHLLGHRGHFLAGHAAKRDRHQKRRCLVVGDLAPAVSLDQECDFALRELPSQALLPNQIDGADGRPALSIPF